jgi:predicted metal-dependent phosphoesterase TrpH
MGAAEAAILEPEGVTSDRALLASPPPAAPAQAGPPFFLSCDRRPLLLVPLFTTWCPTARSRVTRLRIVLLCELHAHSTWSDGTLSLAALVDVYGNAGFDLLCVSDHALADGDPWLASQGTEARHVHAGNHAAYLRAIEEEAERARSLYGLLLVPGLEITCNDPDPVLAAHAVAVGLRSFVSPQVGIAAAMRAAREAGAAIIAAHPHGEERDAFPLRTTQRFFREWDQLAPLVDRVELFNRHDVFPWVAARRLPAVASGDFHRPEHLSSWKTLLPCAWKEQAVIAHLHSPKPAYLLPFAAERLPAEPRVAA